MRYDDEFIRIARAYYNRGLRAARERDLTGAAGYLKSALRFDKYLTEARNLLGLIFYETGETADALAQWVISLNFSTGKNPASRYLAEIEKKAGVLEGEASLIRRFNQALATAQGGGEDFARIELKDIVKKKPGFVRAELLLALLSMKDGDLAEARTALSHAIETDATSPEAQLLMRELVRLEPTASPGEETDLDKPPVQRVLRRTDSLRGVLLVFVGLVLGLMSFYILILPTIKSSYDRTLAENIIRNSDKLSDLSASYSDLSSRYDGLLADYELVSDRLRAYEEENLDFTTAYEMLEGIVNDCARGDYLSAAETYTSLNRDNITAEPLAELLSDVDRLMLTDGFEAIEELGTEAWNGGEKARSEEYYRLCLEIKEDDPEVMYLLARLLQSENRITEANSIFDKIVGEHPESPYAERAVAARGY